MNHALLPILLAASFALAAALAGTTLRLRILRTQLQSAHETQSTSDTQRIQLDTAKNEFVANISHELRTPLTSIRGALGLLSSGLIGAVDPKSHSLLHIALSNTDRLIRLSNELLDLDRISSGHTPLQLRRCSMRELAQGAIETMTPQADAARVRLHLVLDAPPDSLFFDADPDRILQVLTNLLSNAIKFSPPSSIVEIRVAAEPGTLRVRVLDSGRGIPPEKLASIFGRFEQVETADAREKGGAGLGLAICRTIMQQHSGAIWAESNAQHNRGPGAALFITFPRTVRQQDALPAQSSAPALSNGTILICDTDPALRTLVASTILRHGYRVLEAPTPEHALQLAAANHVDAILLDLAMPSREGIALIDWLRRQPALGNLPLIVYSVPELSDPLPLDAPSQTVLSSDVESTTSAPLLPAKVQPHEVEDLVASIVNRLRASKSIVAA